MFLNCLNSETVQTVLTLPPGTAPGPIWQPPTSPIRARQRRPHGMAPLLARPCRPRGAAGHLPVRSGPSPFPSSMRRHHSRTPSPPSHTAAPPFKWPVIAGRRSPPTKFPLPLDSYDLPPPPPLLFVPVGRPLHRHQRRDRAGRRCHPPPLPVRPPPRAVLLQSPVVKLILTPPELQDHPEVTATHQFSPSPTERCRLEPPPPPHRRDADTVSHHPLTLLGAPTPLHLCSTREPHRLPFTGGPPLAVPLRRPCAR
jgi:hypothetical protein